MEAARGQKHPSFAKNGMKESIYWKKFLIRVAQQLENPISDPIRFELQPQGTKYDFEAIEVTDVLSAQAPRNLQSGCS